MALLKLNSLVCHVTDDFSGPDEAVLVIDGQSVFGPHSIRASQSADLSGISPISFSGSVDIGLIDRDLPPFFPDDFLGTVTARESDIGAGQKTGQFRLSGASYDIEYEVLADGDVQIGDNFTFVSGITDAQRARLLERHRFAFSRIMSCGSLSDAERSSLAEAYRRPIQHGINTTPGVNASAFVNGSQLFVNFGVLFPQGDREIAQTLIHEMMHCAGFTHPQRTSNDRPGDNGPYYSTPPLRSEICIAGLQSDLACVEDEQGACTIMQPE